MAAKTCLTCLLSTGDGSFLSFSSNTLVFSPISPPFSSSEPQKIYAKILDGVLKYPPYLSEASKSIISKLCRLKSPFPFCAWGSHSSLFSNVWTLWWCVFVCRPRPGQRLGNTKNGIKDVRHHRWHRQHCWRGFWLLLSAHLTCLPPYLLTSGGSAASTGTSCAWVSWTPPPSDWYARQVQNQKVTAARGVLNHLEALCRCEFATLLLNNFNEPFNIPPKAKCFCVSFIKISFPQKKKVHSKF